MSDPSELTIDEKLDAIGEEWDRVYMAFNPEYDDNNVRLSNKTDEGLGAKGPRKEVLADTLIEAVDEAYTSLDDSS